MGMSTLGRCKTNFAWDNPAPAPNPDPARWTLLDCVVYPGAYVLKVRYHDCTNFEGVKVMVYRGTYSPRRSLDPHFYEGDDAPIARFRPDKEGWNNACKLASTINR